MALSGVLRACLGRTSRTQIRPPTHVGSTLDDVNAPPTVPADDTVAVALNALKARVADEFGESVNVSTNDQTPSVAVTGIEPSDPDSCPVGWIEMGNDELIVDAGRQGGRWEMPRDMATVEFVERLVAAACAGRVTEQFRGKGARLIATMPGGTVVRSFVWSAGARSRPFWRREGREVRYRPYR